jgi:hypothetical protein
MVKNAELIRQIQYIKRLLKSTTESTKSNLELQGHWGKYLCILAAGFLENAIGEIYSDLARKSSSPQIYSFTSKMLQKINNPKSSKFVEIAYAFKKQWGEELEQYFNDNPQKKTGIDSIMANRHLIAHGKTATVSVARLNEYLDSSISVLEFIENQIGVA